MTNSSLFSFMVMLVFIGFTSFSHANEWTQGVKLLKQATKQGAKASDNMPSSYYKKLLKHSDTVGKRTVKSARMTTKVLKELSSANPSLVKKIKAMSPAAQTVIASAYHGSRTLAKKVASSSRRARILRGNGVNTLPLLAKHEDKAAEALLLIDGGIQTRKLPLSTGKQFTNSMLNASEETWRFWTKNIRPHWKKIAGTGLIVSFVATPELYIDKAGKLTEKAASSFAKLGVEVTQSIGSGLIKGVSEKLQEDATGTNATSFWLGAIITMLIIGMFIMRRLRKRC